MPYGFVDAYQEHLDHEMNARYDYVREAFGDPCPAHPGVLRGGADCWKCMNDAADVEQLQDMIDSVAGEPGSLEITRAQRKDVMQLLQRRGWKVVCRGNTVSWGTR